MSFWLEGEAWAQTSVEEHRAGVPGVLARAVEELEPSGRHKRSRSRNAAMIVGTAAVGLAIAFALLSMLGIRQAWFGDGRAQVAEVGTLYRMTLPGPALGLVATDAPAAVTPQTVSVPPVCVASVTGQCTRVEGFERVRLVDQARPDRVANLETINGPVVWRRDIAAVGPGVVMQPLQVRGHPGFFVPASGATGSLQFLQWDEPPGVSVFLSAPTTFSESELLAIADALDTETVTVDVTQPVTQVQGTPAPGVLIDKSSGYIPRIQGRRDPWYVTTLGSSTSRCLGLGPNSDCIRVRYTDGIGYLTRQSERFPQGLIVGIVPSNTRRVLVELDGRSPIKVTPSTSGPAPGQRYVAHWLPRYDDVPTAIVALNDNGLPTNRAVLPSTRRQG